MTCDQPSGQPTPDDASLTTGLEPSSLCSKTKAVDACGNAISRSSRCVQLRPARRQTPERKAAARELEIVLDGVLAGSRPELSHLMDPAFERAGRGAGRGAARPGRAQEASHSVDARLAGVAACIQATPIVWIEVIKNPGFCAYPVPSDFNHNTYIQCGLATGSPRPFLSAEHCVTQPRCAPFRRALRAWVSRASIRKQRGGRPQSSRSAHGLEMRTAWLY